MTAAIFARTLASAAMVEVFADRSTVATMLAFEAARLSNAELLDRLSDAEWARLGAHPQHNPYDVQRWLEIYAAHAHKHADQITRARNSAHR